MKLSRRLLTAERALGGPQYVTWEQVQAAGERMEAALLAKMRAMLDGQPDPAMDPAQREADTRVLNQWRRQQGRPAPDIQALTKTLLANMRELAGNPNWDWSDARRPPGGPR